ncbi:hypothetical protein AV944_06730 [Sphingomonas sp. LK11]|uniref:DUF6950 family protein n=1 Tax=Sphingomonas sp. LK11 TaxID=1390395 RepID=UPI0009729D07|nr:hypothetical protein [Sphingomonas sp. LK11]APX65591.1 hypothetical protein AV944_06730 [Sphingomonas sp. LK11]
MDLIARVNATQATIDKWLDKTFEWGTADCGQMVGSHLESLGLSTLLSQAGTYTTEIGAKRVMKRLGASSMEDFLDKLGLPRIAPASAVVGDVIGFPGGRDEDHQWTALGVHVGASDILGFAAADGEDAIVRVGPVSVATVAWRVG